MVHKGEGIDNNVILTLEDKYLIRREVRAGAPWYELTHDRMIKPIKDSNRKWSRKEDEIKENVTQKTYYYSYHSSNINSNFI